jgi:hypothetical protein
MPSGGPGENPGPTVTVWMGEDVERKKVLYVPLVSYDFFIQP